MTTSNRLANPLPGNPPAPLLRRLAALSAPCVVALSAALAGPAAQAQAFPHKAIRIVVPNAAGGAADIKNFQMTMASSRTEPSSIHTSSVRSSILRRS